MNHYLSRAKRIDNWELVVGYYTPIYQQEISEVGNYYPFTDTIYEAIVTPVETAFAIDKSTLQKCTGWEDKNGNLIFEGQYFGTDMGDELFSLHRITFCRDRAMFIVEEYYDVNDWVEEDPPFSYVWELKDFSNIETFDEVKFNDDGSWERV